MIKKISKKPKTKADYYEYHLILWASILKFLEGLDDKDYIKVTRRPFEQIKKGMFAQLFDFTDIKHNCFLCEYRNSFSDDLCKIFNLSCIGLFNCLNGLYNELIRNFKYKDKDNTIKIIKQILDIPPK
jgi:hypothetical protein